MRHRIAILIVALALLAPFALPSAAHTTHGHTCMSADHGYQLDGSGWRHNAVSKLVPASGGGFWRSVKVTHQQSIWMSPGYEWVTKHSATTSSCLVF